MESGALVVGGSVAGCLCAKKICEDGAQATVLEEDRTPGKLGKCTGIVSKRGLDSLGVGYEKSVLNTVRGATVHSPNDSFSFRTPQVQACVIDRFAFDRQCAAEAQRAGAEILYGRRAEAIVEKNGGYRVKTGNKTHDAKVLVGADGAASLVAREMDFPQIGAKDFVLCYEAEYEECDVKDAAMVDVFLDSGLFKGFFAWIVPTGKTGARIGFGTCAHSELGKAKDLFWKNTRVIETLGKKPEKTRDFTAIIPLRTRRITQKGGCLLVGDAAGQVKATTGGGIVFGGNCAKIAGEEAAAFLKGEKKEIEYERKWRERYGGVLEKHRLFRSVYNKTGNGTVGLALAAGKFLGLPRLIEKFGDMDHILR